VIAKTIYLDPMLRGLSSSLRGSVATRDRCGRSRVAVSQSLPDLSATSGIAKCLQCCLLLQVLPITSGVSSYRRYCQPL
jgi:hypothetical protein